MVISLAHGAGGAESAALMRDVFAKHFTGTTLARLEDAAVVPGGEQLAVSTDTFVVTPLVFPGGDIGKLAAVGTINDVLMSGATPLYLTCGFVLDAGLEISLLDTICGSLAATATEAGVEIIAGDTKVVETRAAEPGLLINTTGIGVCASPGVADTSFSSQQFKPKEVSATPGEPLGPPPWRVILSGTLGDHHAAILSARMGITNSIESDCALLTPLIRALNEANVPVHAMRDVTRGGLATILNELAAASGVSIQLEEASIPVAPEVRAFCGLLGLDPLYMGNEGKAVFAVAEKDTPRALAALRSTPLGASAAIIGHGTASSPLPPVSIKTNIGGTIRLDPLYGEGLPRIC